MKRNFSSFFLRVTSRSFGLSVLPPKRQTCQGRGNVPGSCPGKVTAESKYGPALFSGPSYHAPWGL